jgi:hypothetical protein
MLRTSSQRHAWLDDRPVSDISAYLVEGTFSDRPMRLISNDSSFSGLYYYGAGFVFDDRARGSHSHSVLSEILHREPHSREVVFDLTGGEDILDTPSQLPFRKIIYFGSRSLSESQQFPSLLRLVEQSVKPERDALRDTPDARRLKEYWWQFARDRPALRSFAASLERMIVVPFTAAHFTASFVSASTIVASPHTVICLESDGAFALLQSRPHELWARFFASSMKDDLRYTPSTCFETFPFPEDFESNEAIERAGREYYDFRAALMVKNDEGLTKTYNRFHDRDNREPDIVRLRELHAAMDRAVLDAYGWTDIKTDCDFFADYTEEDEDGNEIEKSIRYRWPDEVRDEVLARLLALNAERHAEEVKLGLVSPDGKRLKRADDDEDGDDADNDCDDAPAPKRVKAGRTKSAAATPKSATRKSAKGKQPKTPKARGKAASRSGRLLFGGDD